MFISNYKQTSKRRKSFPLVTILPPALGSLIATKDILIKYVLKEVMNLEVQKGTMTLF